MSMTAAAAAQDIGQRAQALLAAGDARGAEALLRPLVAAGTGPLPVWKMLAAALRQQQRFAEARDIQAMLVEATPGDLSLRFDLAETLLMLGEFERGWREYRYRYSLAHTMRIERKVQLPRWDGRAIPGQTLLIHDEQGFGDTFQFIRLLPWAKQRSGARLVLEIVPETMPFAGRMEGIDLVISRGTLPPPFQFHCEMMSLPMALRLQMADLPGPMPYLKADPERLEIWRQKLAGLPRPLVALNWAGRPTPDPNRSMPLANLAPLALDGITFISIQKGPQVAEAKNPPAGMRLIEFGAALADFDDTAAILSLADLLISIDSAPLHLAGALGRPAWGMLMHLADWRWLSARADSPWYPSMRLFRQAARGDWPSVTNRIAAELAVWRRGG